MKKGKVTQVWVKLRYHLAVKIWAEVLGQTEAPVRRAVRSQINSEAWGQVSDLIKASIHNKFQT